MKKTILFLAAFLIPFALAGQIKDVSLSKETPVQFGRMDFTVKLTGQWTNPYLMEQATLDMAVKTPSGKELVVPCYFESGASGKVSTWKARFTPREAGVYEYAFRYAENGKLKSSTKEKNFACAPSSGKGFLRVKDNWTLSFDNGEPFRGVAENICWESRTNDDSRHFKSLNEMSDKYNYDYLIPQFAENGGNFTRVWMCSWNFPIDRPRNFNNHRYTDSDEYFNLSAVARLDHFVQLCEEQGVYVMLCMGQGDVQANHEFFVSHEAMQRYRNRARYIIARWGYSPNIAMWEFFNEIDNIQYRNPNNPIPDKDITEWHAQMCRFFRSTDPYGHILTTSISHRDVEGLNSIPEMDINQKHIYRNTSALSREIVAYEKEFGKPYIIGEFGYEWDWSKNFDEFGEEMDTDFKRGLWYGIFSSTPVTPMSWWWEYFENRNMVPYFRGVRHISDRMLSDGKGRFEPVGVTAGKADAYAVKCGDVIYAYIYNGGDENLKNNLVIDLRGERYDVQEFDTKTMKYTAMGTVSGVTGIHYTKMDMAPKTEKLLLFTSRAN